MVAFKMFILSRFQKFDYNVTWCGVFFSLAFCLEFIQLESVGFSLL